MEPASSPLVAEVMALWSAVQQLHRLSYTKVIFLGDCLKLIKILYDKTGGNHDQREHIPDVINIIQDIGVIAKKNVVLVLRHVPRKLIDVVDKLAKEARVNDRDYIISWLNF
ncbi:unnamed protein product [Eruca vesicaria subsp. sativa]|uniref:RNase H type-1 domain-containing protein n=1 Tax=Eruca vesicaria subsp. sativa TaxID=29727 RepID=A0ABC8J9B7_ERUVS|nr:unnamed protein product [Eruca vesicaria subsp. sativa]